MTTPTTKLKIIERTYDILKHRSVRRAQVYKIITDWLKESLVNCDMNTMVENYRLYHCIELRYDDASLDCFKMSSAALHNILEDLFERGLLIRYTPHPYYIPRKTPINISSPEFEVNLPPGMAFRPRDTSESIH